MHLKIALIQLLVFVAATAWAQMSTQPGSETKMLDYFVGSWTLEGTIGQGPWGMGGKFTSADTWAWMPGNFFVEGHSEFSMPSELGGDGKAVSLMGYDTDRNVYTYDEFNSQGRREKSTGSFSRDTWTWSSSQNYDGQAVEQKMTMKVRSSTNYDLRFEVSMDGGKTWSTFMEGKATKK